ncbi:MAG: class I SAM-dependent methyltransferase [Mastigocoleus sp. MO_167.B18]|nr:class I SAM-dependent methyltransferase [Mastigocoleus sp. MO_167.B18]
MKDLEQRKNWFSPVAAAYNKARPSYPTQIVRRVVELARLSSDSIILELGCGPGTATITFAQLGFSMLCIEPSQDFYEIALRNCQQYPKIEINRTSFEEWELETNRFDAVMAASAFHWISPQVAYSKAADALKDDGFLILLWNMTPQIPYEVYQVLNEVYGTQVPPLTRYETREAQEKILWGFGRNILKSGRFKGLISENILCKISYQVDLYLELLSTFSPYRAIPPSHRDSLFAGLRKVIQNHFGDYIQISYLSAFHVAQKI